MNLVSKLQYLDECFRLWRQELDVFYQGFLTLLVQSEFRQDRFPSLPQLDQPNPGRLGIENA